MTIDWHLDTELAQRYADGEVGTVLAASVEQHIVACARCQALLVPAVDSVRIDRVWAEVLERVEAPRISLFERSLRRLGVSDDTARLIALTPSLRGGWLSGVALVLTLALFVSRSGPHGIAFFRSECRIRSFRHVHAFSAQRVGNDQHVEAFEHGGRKLLFIWGDLITVVAN